ncbi:hypothetical protein Bca4012_094850 [Brassica carinata]
MEAIRVSERRLYRRIYAGSFVSVLIHLFGITTCTDSTPLTIAHSMIRTPLPSGAKLQKVGLERSHFYQFPASTTTFFDLWEE